MSTEIERERQRERETERERVPALQKDYPNRRCLAPPPHSMRTQSKTLFGKKQTGKEKTPKEGRNPEVWIP